MWWIFHVILIIVNIAVPFSHTGYIPWEEESSAMSMSGCAAFYSKGRMETTATILGYIDSKSDYSAWLEGAGYIGAVAVYRLGDKGKDVHILWPDGTIDGPYIAIDVVSKKHYSIGLDKNRVIDVDYKTAVRHNMRGPVAVTIIYNGTVLFDTVDGSDNAIDVGITVDKYKGCVGITNG